MTKTYRMVAVLGSTAALGAGGMAAVQAATATGASRASGTTTNGRGRAAASTANCEFAGRRLPAGERKALEQVWQAVATQAPSIAKPILDQAVTDKKITQAQEDAFLARLSRAPGKGPEPSTAEAPPPGPPTAQEFAVRRQVFEAIRRQLPSIAKPILDKAVADKSITQAQEDQILKRLTDGPAGMKPGIGFGRGPGMWRSAPGGGDPGPGPELGTGPEQGPVMTGPPA